MNRIRIKGRTEFPGCGDEEGLDYHFIESNES
jgi:hypothetical protein